MPYVVKYEFNRVILYGVTKVTSHRRNSLNFMIGAAVLELQSPENGDILKKR